LIRDPDIDAVYIATPPSSHLDLALRVAAAGKPCLVEKPMAMTHGECVRMNDAFRAAACALRGVLPRALRASSKCAATRGRAIGPSPTCTSASPNRWRRARPPAAGASIPPSRRGLFYDLASHCLDLVDFLLGPIDAAAGIALNTGGTYAAEDVTAGAFRFAAAPPARRLELQRRPHRGLDVFTGPRGQLHTPVFTDGDVVITRGTERDVLPLRNPPHVHQPLIQTIVDELRGRGRCESTGESGARASWSWTACSRITGARRSQKPDYGSLDAMSLARRIPLSLPS